MLGKLFGQGDDKKLEEFMRNGGHVAEMAMIMALAKKMGIGPATLMRAACDIEGLEQYAHEMAKEMMDIAHEKHRKEKHNLDKVE